MSFDLKSKFQLYAKFIKDHILDYCDPSAITLFQTYIISFDFLSPDFIIQQIIAFSEKSNIPLDADSLQERYIQTFKIRFDELSEINRLKFHKWLQFLCSVCTQYKKVE